MNLNFPRVLSSKKVLVKEVFATYLVILSFSIESKSLSEKATRRGATDLCDAISFSVEELGGLGFPDAVWTLF